MRAFLAVMVLSLSACGFQLRGTAALPFETLYIANMSGGSGSANTSSGVALDLKRNIQGGTRTRIVTDEKSAQARLELSGETKFRNILSLSGAGRVRELQLIYRINLRVHDGKGGEFVPLTTLSIARDLTYNDTDVLAKEAEQASIYREMQTDLVQQILRRLSAASPAKPVVE
jgi:LPS-assembly lipoprotein